MELVLIILLTLLTVPVVEFTTGPLRIIAGVIILLLFPGYALMAALFPRKLSMQSVERVVLSVVLSFAVVPLIVLIFNYTPWGISLEPIFGAVASLIVIASLVALFRRWRLPQSVRFAPRIRIRMPQWGGGSRLDKAISLVLVLLILGAAAALFYVITTPRAPETFTDFYVLGSEEMVEDYPQELVLGEQAEVTLGIINHEHQDMSYTVEVRLDGEKVQEIAPINLAHEKEWRQKVTLVPAKAGEDQKVEFLLYKGEGIDPYLTLYLWLDVKEGV